MSSTVCPRCTKVFENELGRPRECEECVMSEAESQAAIADAIEDRQEDDRIQAEADAQDDHQSMVESTTDRIFAEDGMMEHPTVTDFTEVVCLETEFAKVPLRSEYVLRVKLISGANIVMVSGLSKKETERRELAINQAMIEYRAKMNAWEAQLLRQGRQTDVNRQKNVTLIE